MHVITLYIADMHIKIHDCDPDKFLRDALAAASDRKLRHHLRFRRVVQRRSAQPEFTLGHGSESGVRLTLQFARLDEHSGLRAAKTLDQAISYVCTEK